MPMEGIAIGVYGRRSRDTLARSTRKQTSYFTHIKIRLKRIKRTAMSRNKTSERQTTLVFLTRQVDITGGTYEAVLQESKAGKKRHQHFCQKNKTKKIAFGWRSSFHPSLTRV